MTARTPAPRNVLLLHATAGGYGADRRLEALAAGLDPGRYRPIVVLPERGELAGRLEEAGVELRLLPLATLRRDLLRGRRLATTGTRLHSSARAIAQLALERRAALVHTQTSLVLGGQAVADRAGIPHLLHVRDVYPGAGGRAGDLLWPVLRRLLARADALACPSQAVAAQFGGHGRAFVLRDAPPRQLVIPDRAAARSILGLDPTSFVVAVVGRLSDWKGQDVLLRALAEPELAAAGAVGILAGEAAAGQEHFERRLAALARELGLGERLRLLGFRDDVEVVLAAADAVAVPSRRPEGLPHSLLEAAWAARPIVASDSGGQRELIRHGETGLLVPPGDPAALAAALLGLAHDPARARRLGEAAAAGLAAQPRYLEELQEHYDRLVAASRRAAWLLPGTRPDGSPRESSERLEQMAGRLRDAGYEPSTWAPSPRLRSAVSVALRAVRERPALVVTSAAVAGPALAALERLPGRRVRVVADLTGLRSREVEAATAGRRGPPSRRLRRRLEQQLVRSAHVVLAADEQHAALVRRLRPAGVHVVPPAGEAVAGSGGEHAVADAVSSGLAALDGRYPTRPAPRRAPPRLISVVICVRNAERTIADQLAGLCRQTYTGGWEVIVVDDGSRDRTVEVAAAWRDRLPGLRVARAQGRRGVNHARNVGAATAAGDFLAFCDGDDVVADDWLAELARAAQGADLVSGRLERERLNATPGRLPQPPDTAGELPVASGFLPYAAGGNCGLWADVAHALDWDEAFAFGSSDIEFSWRARLAGYRVAYAPGAVLHVRDRTGLRALVRQHYSYGLSDPQLYRKFRRSGFARDRAPVVLRRWSRLVRRSPDLVGSPEASAAWLRSAARYAGRLAGSVRHRTLYL